MENFTFTNITYITKNFVGLERFSTI